MSGQNYTTPESVPIAMNTGNPEAHHVLPVEASIWTLSDNDILGARFVDAKTGGTFSTSSHLISLRGPR